MVCCAILWCAMLYCTVLSCAVLQLFFLTSMYSPTHFVVAPFVSLSFSDTVPHHTITCRAKPYHTILYTRHLVPGKPYHTIPSRPIWLHPIPSHQITWHPPSTPSHPIPSRLVPSHPHSTALLSPYPQLQKRRAQKYAKDSQANADRLLALGVPINPVVSTEKVGGRWGGPTETRFDKVCMSAWYTIGLGYGKADMVTDACCYYDRRTWQFLATLFLREEAPQLSYALLR